jgi:hypothetical protein
MGHGKGNFKAVERRVAALARGRRIPVTGERAGADVLSDRYAFQVKSRKTIPTWLWAWLAGIVGSAMRSKRIGVLVLKRPNDRLLTHGLVVLRFADWLEITNGDGGSLDPLDVEVEGVERPDAS